jgi:hypothetical protein
MTVAGAAAAFLMLMAPQIASGHFMDSFIFMTSRASSDVGPVSTIGMLTGNVVIIVYLAGIAVSIIMGYLLSKKKEEELDSSFLKYSTLMIAFLFIYPPAPQYVVLLIPFLAMCIATADGRLKVGWALISIGGIGFILSGNFVLFLSMGTFTDMMSLEYIMSMISWFQTPAVFGVSPMAVLYYTFGAIQYIGIVVVFLLLLKDTRIGTGINAYLSRLNLSRSSSCRRSKE